MRVSTPASGSIGAEVTDLNTTTLTPEQAATLRETVYAHKLLVIRDQELSAQEYVALARKIGRPQIYFQGNYHHPEHPEIFVSSNVLVRGKKVGVAGTGRYWHTDYQFFPEPLPMTMLSPQVLPRGKRETYYIDMARVYATLPDDLRRMVDGRRAIHDAKLRYKITADDIDLSVAEVMEKFSKEAPPITHPAVITHPVSKQKILYMSRGFTVGLEGLSHEESEKTLARLYDFVEREDHVHTHRWQQGDILLWDNRPLLHMASSTPPGEPSVSHRIGIYDDVPFYNA